MGVTDSSGSLTAETRYLPFGEVRTDVGTITGTDFGYTFQRNLPDTGLMDYKARAYDPWLGRFVQPDTIVPGAGNPQAYNRYGYVNNSPEIFTDFTGHLPEWVNAIVDFVIGFSSEYLLVNNWIGDILVPDIANSLASSVSDSNAMTTGRIVADIFSIGSSIGQIVIGSGIAGGGIVIGCGTTACLAAAPAAATGIVITANGIAVLSLSSTKLGENLSKFTEEKQLPTSTATNSSQNSSQMRKLTPGEIRALKRNGYNAEDLKWNKGTGKWDLLSVNRVQNPCL